MNKWTEDGTLSLCVDWSIAAAHPRLSDLKALMRLKSHNEPHFSEAFHGIKAVWNGGLESQWRHSVQ